VADTIPLRVKEFHRKHRLAWQIIFKRSLRSTILREKCFRPRQDVEFLNHISDKKNNNSWSSFAFYLYKRTLAAKSCFILIGDHLECSVCVNAVKSTSSLDLIKLNSVKLYLERSFINTPHYWYIAKYRTQIMAINYNSYLLFHNLC